MSGPLPLEISLAEAAGLLDERPAGLLLIDVREPDEFAICRIEGAELMPLSAFGETAKARFAGSSERVLVYCHHGMRSLRAVEYLRSLGCENAQSIAQGIEGWSGEIDPEVPRY